MEMCRSTALVLLLICVLGGPKAGFYLSLIVILTFMPKLSNASCLSWMFVTDFVPFYTFSLASQHQCDNGWISFQGKCYQFSNKPENFQKAMVRAWRFYSFTLSDIGDSIHTKYLHNQWINNILCTYSS